jgi:glycosyltransferase involved in cell wall biosynthesis
MPQVSIIVPNYNHSKFLKQRLDSIFNQTFQDFEVILLDDCSTDNSRDILEEYAKNSKVSHCVYNEVNSGNTFVQWNKGLELAKGDFIWIAESDDCCELNFLEKLLQPFLSDSEIVLAYCQSNRVNIHNEITGDWLNHTDNLNSNLFLKDFVLVGNEFLEKFLIYKNVIPNVSAVLFRKSKVLNLDLDSVLKYNGDWLFYLKLIVNGKVAYINEKLNNYRYHSNSVIANAVRVNGRDSLIDVELKTREKMFDFISKNSLYNWKDIEDVNNEIIKKLKYEKALFLIEDNQIIKGLIILIPVFNIFLKKKKVKFRILNFFKYK